MHRTSLERTPHSLLRNTTVLLAVVASLAAGCSKSNKDAVPAEKTPPPAEVTCAAACDHLQTMTMTALKNEVAALPADTAANLVARAEDSRASDLQRCEKKCSEGGLEPGCVIGMTSLTDLAKCVPKRDKLAPAEASAAVATHCASFTAAAAADESCDALAPKLEDIARALRDVKGDDEDPALEACVDLTIELSEGRCSEHADYKAAMSMLLAAALAN